MDAGFCEHLVSDLEFEVYLWNPNPSAPGLGFNVWSVVFDARPPFPLRVQVSL